MSFPIVFEITGQHFAGSVEVASNMEPGESLTLERDSDNEYDKNAIKVLYSGQKIGFVNAKMAAAIAPIMDGLDSLELAAEVAFPVFSNRQYGVMTLVDD